MSKIYYTCRIDTDHYAGNFEREMVAFITGQVGECCVGEEYAKLADKELTTDATVWFMDNTLMTSDEHGCWRPVEIVLTPPENSNNNSVQVRFKENPTNSIREIIKERALMFAKTTLDRWDRYSDIQILNIEYEQVEEFIKKTSLQ